MHKIIQLGSTKPGFQSRQCDSRVCLCKDYSILLQEFIQIHRQQREVILGKNILCTNCLRSKTFILIFVSLTWASYFTYQVSSFSFCFSVSSKAQESEKATGGTFSLFLNPPLPGSVYSSCD